MLPLIPYVFCRIFHDSGVDSFTSVCKGLSIINLVNCVPFSPLQIFRVGRGKVNPYGAQYRSMSNYMGVPSKGDASIVHCIKSLFYWVIALDVIHSF